MGIPDHLTCLLKSLYEGLESTVRTRRGTSSKFEKEYVKAVYCHPVYLTYMQSTSCRDAVFLTTALYEGMSPYVRVKTKAILDGSLSLTLLIA